MNNQLQTFEHSNPALFRVLVEHPEIQVVDCYFQLESLQFHTLWHISEKLMKAGYKKEHISEAVKIYLDA